MELFAIAARTWQKRNARQKQMHRKLLGCHCTSLYNEIAFHGKHVLKLKDAGQNKGYICLRVRKRVCLKKRCRIERGDEHVIWTWHECGCKNGRRRDVLT